MRPVAAAIIIIVAVAVATIAFAIIALVCHRRGRNGHRKSSSSQVVVAVIVPVMLLFILLVFLLVVLLVVIAAARRCLFSSSARPALATAARGARAPLGMGKKRAAASGAPARSYDEADDLPPPLAERWGQWRPQHPARSYVGKSIARVSKSRGLPADVTKQMAGGMWARRKPDSGASSGWRCRWRVDQQRVFARSFCSMYWGGRGNGANSEL